jgi:predicted RNA polymerase sigma factor
MPEAGAVLEVLYLVFNEGYAATSGEDWMRPVLCEEALRLGRVLVGLLPDEPEAFGLLALMELQASRMPARTQADGTPILLPEQSARAGIACGSSAGCRRWNAAKAHQTGAQGPYALQAAIAACHAHVHFHWRNRTGRGSRGLACVADAGAPSAVVELNRAVAVGRAFGADAAMPIVEAPLRPCAVACGAWRPAAALAHD